MRILDVQNSEFLHKAMHMVRLTVPFLSELTEDLELKPSKEVKTAGIFASGRLVYNPDWISNLTIQECAFVLAHEVMHLALQSHDRARAGDEALFNITHDFLINDFLKESFGLSITPVDGLDWEIEFKGYYPLQGKSAEELLKFIIDALESGQLSRNIFQLHWNRDLSFDGEKPNLPLENKLRALFPEINPQPIQVADTLQSMDGIDTDVLDEELEELFFPNKSKNNQRKRQSLIKKLGINALSNHMVMEAAESLFRPMGSEPGNVSRWYESLQTAYQVNWEAALQRWMESVNRMGHSYARPSRRGQFSDFVLPGHLREGRTLNIIMDTSASMSSTLSNVLGAISYSCHQHQVDQVRILQCDTVTTCDNWYSLEDLSNFEAFGFGGSDMSDAMYRLASDLEVQYAIIITDGCIGLPEESMPYEVLWVLTDPYGARHFTPPYGTVLTIN